MGKAKDLLKIGVRFRRFVVGNIYPVSPFQFARTSRPLLVFWTSFASFCCQGIVLVGALIELIALVLDVDGCCIAEFEICCDVSGMIYGETVLSAVSNILLVSDSLLLSRIICGDIFPCFQISVFWIY